jgi:hypothetical protein
VEITTIRVEKAVRDRLAARAASQGRSLGAELDAMLREADWHAIETAYQRLAEEPAELARYQTESEALTVADLDELAATAAEEYPEYNA